MAATDAQRLSLERVLAYHMLQGSLVSGDVRGGGAEAAVHSMAGPALRLVRNATGMYVLGGRNGARVVRQDIVAGLGIVHVVDAVLLPPAA